MRKGKIIVSMEEWRSLNMLDPFTDWNFRSNRILFFFFKKKGNSSEDAI